jgi:nucleotide-binding universal stress UspA family protein
MAALPSANADPSMRERVAIAVMAVIIVATNRFAADKILARTRKPKCAVAIPGCRALNRVVKISTNWRRVRRTKESFMYGKILVPVDGSEASTWGLNEAIKIAKSQGSELRLVHVVNEYILDYTYSPGIYSTNLIESLRKGGRTILDLAEAVVQRHGITPECVLLESIGGAAADLILVQAKEWPADLIVMGTHGRRGLLRVALGSDAEQVVRSAAVPVLLVRCTAPQSKHMPKVAPVAASAA